MAAQGATHGLVLATGELHDLVRGESCIGKHKLGAASGNFLYALISISGHKRKYAEHDPARVERCAIALAALCGHCKKSYKRPLTE